MRDEERIATALDIIECYGGIDGAHHKQWVLDRVVRALTGPGYAAWVDGFELGGEGKWEQGVAP